MYDVTVKVGEVGGKMRFESEIQYFTQVGLDINFIFRVLSMALSFLSDSFGSFSFLSQFDTVSKSLSPINLSV